MNLQTGDPYLSTFLSSFIQDKINCLNVYKHLKTSEEILSRWRDCRLHPTDTIFRNRYRVHKVYDADTGVRQTLSRSDLLTLVERHPHLLKTVVYLKYQHGNLFSLIPQEEIQEDILYTNVTSVVEDMAIGLFHHAKIGDYIPTNQLYHGKDYDGIEATLEQTLKSKAFICYTVATYDTISLMDYPD